MAPDLKPARKAYLGHVLSALAMLASLGLSLGGAINPAIPVVSGFFMLAAFITEPLKIVFNRVIWKTIAATRGQRILAVIAYLICICVSVGLTHLLVERLVGEMVAEDDAQAAQEAGRRTAADKARALELADLKALEGELEAARTDIIPLPHTNAQIRDKLKGQLSKAERDQLNRDLARDEKNGQAAAKVHRLTERLAQTKEKFELSEGERSRTSAGRPSDANVRVVRDVRDVRGQYSLLAVFLAFVFELAISGGVWADQLYNKRHATVEATQEPENHRPNHSDDRTTASSGAFRDHLRREWSRKRAKDGWLEGTQHEWAQQLKVTPGFVHHQLKRMERQGLIQKKASAKKTWVRFVEKAKLKLVVET